MGWLQGLWALLRALPVIWDMIKKAMAEIVTRRNEDKLKQNEEIRKEIENAKTPEEKQAALDKLSRRNSGN